MLEPGTPIADTSNVSSTAETIRHRQGELDFSGSVNGSLQPILSALKNPIHPVYVLCHLHAYLTLHKQNYLAFSCPITSCRADP